MFFAGMRRGERLERERRDHERTLERERQQYERELERERQQRELVSKVADEYVRMARNRYDAGPHALASIGLDVLGSDALIREAIREMHVRSGSDPWSGHGAHVKGIDLVRFFKYVRENRLNFFSISVEEVAQRVRSDRETTG